MGSPVDVGPKPDLGGDGLPRTRTVAWFNCFAGVAGDMALGALVDAGLPIEDLQDELKKLNLPGWSIKAEKVSRSSLMATDIKVLVSEESTPSRSWRTIREHIGGSALTQSAKSRSLGVFELLARAEAVIHGVDPDDVHFHEVGAIDSIIDIVGTAIALDLLGVSDVFVTPIPNGWGSIGTSHGRYPNPSPAVGELLKGVPSYGVDVPMELSTPTGVALMVYLATDSGMSQKTISNRAARFGPMPAMEVTGVGYGAGDRDTEGSPNCLQVVIGRALVDPNGGEPPVIAPDSLGGTYETVVLLESNLDDVTGEQLGYCIERLMGIGALDCWVAPVTGKKSRPAFVFSVLCSVGSVRMMTEVVAKETGTLGIRVSHRTRWVSDRTLGESSFGEHVVRLKQGQFGVKAEFDDVSAAAKSTSKTFREVKAKVERETDRRS